MDKYDQRMLWQNLANKESQLVIVKFEFKAKSCAELDRIAEKSGSKKIVHSVEQERETILKSKTRSTFNFSTIIYKLVIVFRAF